MGLSTTAYRRIGLLEIAGAIGLLLGSIEPLIGAIRCGPLLLLGGAVVAHLRQGDGPRKFAPAVVCALLVAAYLSPSRGDVISPLP